MRAIKKINNNVSLCIDDNGVELIAFGKGIGYPDHPYEINDLSLIHRTFYGINAQYIDFLTTIPTQIIEISLKIVELTNEINTKITNSNVVLTLADHINFAITRHHSGIKVKYNWYADIAYKYPDEVRIGQLAIDMIEEETNTRLSSNEAYGIAIHIINAQVEKNDTPSYDLEVFVQELVKIVEHNFNITIDRSSFSYTRFHSHILFLVDRIQRSTNITTDNIQVFDVLKLEYKKSYESALEIAEAFSNHLEVKLNDEEILYLIIHINRLSSREA